MNAEGSVSDTLKKEKMRKKGHHKHEAGGRGQEKFITKSSKMKTTGNYCLLRTPAMAGLF